MDIPSETAMIDLGRRCAARLTFPAVFELVGDVGTGKTTFTRGLAAGLGISDPITSPSFTISKRYPLDAAGRPGELVHYDFYRLDDPGLMRDELSETLASPSNVAVIEWGGDVADLLPATTYRLEFALTPTGSRRLTPNPAAARLIAEDA